MKIHSIQTNYSDNKSIRRSLKEDQTTSMPQPAAPTPSFCANRANVAAASVLAGLLTIAPAAAKPAVTHTTQHVSTLLPGAPKLFTDAFNNHLKVLFEKGEKIAASSFAKAASKKDSHAGDTNLTKMAMDYPERIATTIIEQLKKEPFYDKNSLYSTKLETIIKTGLKIKNKYDARFAAEFAQRVNRIINNQALRDEEKAAAIAKAAFDYGQSISNLTFENVVRFNEQMAQIK